MNVLSRSLDNVRVSVNNQLINQEPWKIVTVTATSVLAGVWLWQLIFQNDSLYNRSKKYIFRLARKIPFIAKQIDEELDKVERQFEGSVEKRNKGVPYIQSLKKNGMSKEDIINEVTKYLSLGPYKWKEGFVSGAVYSHDNDLVDLLTKVYGMASYTNPLHIDVFPGVCKMEAEVVRITANLFEGGPKTCGAMTSGGTESILMACKAYRDFAYHEKGITKPEMVLPRTAHPAFEKAGSYFGISMKYVQVDPVSMTVSINLMRRSISRNTIMLVGSAPNFPYGTMDDIEAIAKLGQRYNIPVHVDCCLGGFLTAFMPKAGLSIAPFNFSVPGVTSISADTHKYAYAPKGSSVILYSDLKYRHYQYCVSTEWPGGVYGSPTVNGSRAGGIIVSCWATLMYYGIDGYVEATKRVVETTKFIESRLREMEDIFIFGKPVTSVIAIGSKKFHIYRLCEKLNNRGWNLNALQYPPGIHICVTKMHTMDGVADRFIDDVKSGLQEISKEPEEKMEGMLAMYGMAQGIPDRSIVADFTHLFLDAMYYVPKTEEKSNCVENGIKSI